jgi:hypothetical protein
MSGSEEEMVVNRVDEALQYREHVWVQAGVVTQDLMCSACRIWQRSYGALSKESIASCPGVPKKRL